MHNKRVESRGRAFEFFRKRDRARRARLDTKPAIHAFAKVNIEPDRVFHLVHRLPVLTLDRGLVDLRTLDPNAIDRACFHAKIASNADFWVDVQKPTEAVWQRTQRPLVAERF